MDRRRRQGMGGLAAAREGLDGSLCVFLSDGPRRARSALVLVVLVCTRSSELTGAQSPRSSCLSCDECCTVTRTPQAQEDGRRKRMGGQLELSVVNDLLVPVPCVHCSIVRSNARRDEHVALSHLAGVS
ncbi:hypothetical protein GY45DRAFT_1169860 [Cubamyces sp. BRFM 1775]|nr:hypothetical protein GY45DRAFT_1169860 [Cubamyces sp. BRFM 1775]